MLTAPVTAFISPNKSWKFIKGAFGPNRKGPEKVLLFLWNYPLLDFLFKDGIIRKINQGGLLDKIIVGILRREQKDLLQEEVLAIEHAFPGKEIQYIISSTQNFAERSSRAWLSCPWIALFQRRQWKRVSCMSKPPLADCEGFCHCGRSSNHMFRDFISPATIKSGWANYFISVLSHFLLLFS